MVQERLSSVVPVRRYKTPGQLAQMVLHNLRALILRDFGAPATDVEASRPPGARRRPQRLTLSPAQACTGR